MVSVSLTDLIGWFASTLSVVSLIPQAWRTWRSRSVRDLSIGWLSLAFLAAIAWAAYGFLLKSLEVLATNIVVALLITFLMLMKGAFHRR